MTEYQRHRDEQERRSDNNRFKIASPHKMGFAMTHMSC